MTDTTSGPPVKALVFVSNVFLLALLSHENLHSLPIVVSSVFSPESTPLLIQQSPLLYLANLFICVFFFYLFIYFIVCMYSYKESESDTVTPESAKWKTLNTIRCQRVVWDCFCISLKTNRTPVTQELYLDEKTMPHVYVIVSRIYGSYTRSYILMRKQCIMFMLLLAASTADY